MFSAVLIINGFGDTRECLAGKSTADQCGWKVIMCPTLEAAFLILAAIKRAY